MTGGRYLIVRLGALGDVVMTSTLIPAIRQRDASAHITWLCGSAVADIVREIDGVDEIIVADDFGLLTGTTARRVRALLQLWRLLLGRQFEVCALGHADRRYRWLLQTARIGRLRALVHEPSPRMLPIPGRYQGDELVRLLDDEDSQGPIVGHYALASLRPVIDSDSAQLPAAKVVLVPGGTRNLLRVSALRRWPVEQYRVVAEGLVAAGHEVMLIGDAGDTWVRPFFEGLSVRDEIGAHDLAGTLALIRRADLVISHDTGPMHLARLARVPLVALFGPTMPLNFLGSDGEVAVLWGGADLACRPCYDGREFARCRNNICIQEITPADVLSRAAALLERGRARRVTT